MRFRTSGSCPGSRLRESRAANVARTRRRRTTRSSARSSAPSRARAKIAATANGKFSSRPLRRRTRSRFGSVSKRLSATHEDGRSIRLLSMCFSGFGDRARPRVIRSESAALWLPPACAARGRSRQDDRRQASTPTVALMIEELIGAEIRSPKPAARHRANPARCRAVRVAPGCCSRARCANGPAMMRAGHASVRRTRFDAARRAAMRAWRVLQLSA